MRRNFKINFHGADIPFSRSVRAHTVLKIGNVYRQGRKSLSKNVR